MMMLMMIKCVCVVNVWGFKNLFFFFFFAEEFFSMMMNCRHHHHFILAEFGVVACLIFFSCEKNILFLVVVSFLFSFTSSWIIAMNLNVFFSLFSKKNFRKFFFLRPLQLMIILCFFLYKVFFLFFLFIRPCCFNPFIHFLLPSQWFMYVACCLCLMFVFGSIFFSQSIFKFSVYLPFEASCVSEWERERDFLLKKMFVFFANGQ